MQPEDQRQLGTRQMIKVTKNVSCCLNTAHDNAATGTIPTLKKIPTPANGAGGPKHRRTPSADINGSSSLWSAIRPSIRQTLLKIV